MTDEIARKLLKIVDRLVDEHFFQTNGLRQLGWCGHYMLDMRGLKYCKKNPKLFKKLKLLNFIGLINRQIDLINNNF